MTPRDEHVSEVRAWEEATCLDCGFPFPRRHTWEDRCLICFKLNKDYNILQGDMTFLWAQERVLALQMELGTARRELNATKTGLTAHKRALKTARAEAKAATKRAEDAEGTPLPSGLSKGLLH